MLKKHAPTSRTSLKEMTQWAVSSTVDGVVKSFLDEATGSYMNNYLSNNHHRMPSIGNLSSSSDDFIDPAIMVVGRGKSSSLDMTILTSAVLRPFAKIWVVTIQQPRINIFKAFDEETNSGSMTLVNPFEKWRTNQQLFSGGSPDSTVRQYNSNPSQFGSDFAAVVIKMDDFRPLTGSSGESRRNYITRGTN
ncbi:peroxidase P7 [Tanacetum coccineum]